MLLLALVESAQGYLSETMAMAVIALLGYLVGHRTRQENESVGNNDSKLVLELTRAVQIANELHTVAQRIRQDVASHQASISQFEIRVGKLKADDSAAGWQTLISEAESLLTPTMQLATKLSLAYDQLRKQSALLTNFTGSRTDSETGVSNRRAMEEQLEVLFSLHAQNDSRFALSLFSVEDVSDGSARLTQRADADSLNPLARFAEILTGCARDTDLVARYSMDEFVVLMPQTSMAGAAVFSDRLLKRVNAELDCVACGGIVVVLPEDTPEKLLSRADSALYSARASDVCRLFQHNGKAIRAHGEGQNPGLLEASRANDCPSLPVPEIVQPALDVPEPDFSRA